MIYDVLTFHLLSNYAANDVLDKCKHVRILDLLCSKKSTESTSSKRNQINVLINNEMLKLLLGLILTMSILTFAKGKDQSSNTPEPIICQQPCTSNGVCD